MQEISLFRFTHFKPVLVGVMFLIGIISGFSCNDSLPITDTTNNIGSQAILLVSFWEYGFDLGKEKEPFVEYTFEYYDSGKLNGGVVGDFLNEIRFLISFRNYNGTIERDDVLLDKVSVSEMVRNKETGNLNYTLYLNLEAALQHLDLDPDEVGVNDRFTIDWEMKLKDGKKLNPKCPDWPVNSDSKLCEVSIPLSHSLPEDSFTGRYRFEQQEVGPFGMWLFSETFEAVLSVDPDNPFSGRQFKAVPYSAAGDLDSVLVTLGFGRNATTVRDIGTGYVCAPGAEVHVGPARPLHQNEVNLKDDSRFTLILNENSSGDCGVPEEVIAFTVTKIE